MGKRKEDWFRERFRDRREKTSIVLRWSVASDEGPRQVLGLTFSFFFFSLNFSFKIRKGLLKRNTI